MILNAADVNGILGGNLHVLKIIRKQDHPHDKKRLLMLRNNYTYYDSERHSK